MTTKTTMATTMRMLIFFVDDDDDELPTKFPLLLKNIYLDYDDDDYMMIKMNQIMILITMIIIIDIRDYWAPFSSLSSFSLSVVRHLYNQKKETNHQPTIQSNVI